MFVENNCVNSGENINIKGHSLQKKTHIQVLYQHLGVDMPNKVNFRKEKIQQGGCYFSVNLML